MSSVQRLVDLGITLPPVPGAVGAYTGWIRTGHLLVTSGQLPWKDGALAYVGKVGADVTELEGQDAARLCAINALAQIHHALGSLDLVKQIVRLDGYVHSAPGFRNQPFVLNGASELLNAIFGDRGRHTRVALGLSEMPLGAAVQLSLTVEA